jgi:hypothetical protein
MARQLLCFGGGARLTNTSAVLRWRQRRGGGGGGGNSGTAAVATGDAADADAASAAAGAAAGEPLLSFDTASGASGFVLCEDRPHDPEEEDTGGDGTQTEDDGCGLFGFK